MRHKPDIQNNRRNDSPGVGHSLPGSNSTKRFISDDNNSRRQSLIHHFPDTISPSLYPLFGFFFLQTVITTIIDGPALAISPPTNRVLDIRFLVPHRMQRYFVLYEPNFQEKLFPSICRIFLWFLLQTVTNEILDNHTLTIVSPTDSS